MYNWVLGAFDFRERCFDPLTFILQDTSIGFPWFLFILQHFTVAHSSVPLQASTENKEKFQKWPVSLPQFQKKEEYVSPTERMNLSTTTAEAFVKHQIQPLVLAKAQLPPKRSPAPFSVGRSVTGVESPG